MKWKEEGLKVKKGSKAFLFWGKPKKGQKKTKENIKPGESSPEDEYKFFPLAYLFSDKQVEKIEVSD